MLQKCHALSRLGPSTFNDALEMSQLSWKKIKNTALTPSLPLFAKGSASRLLPTWHIGTKVAEAP